MRQAWLCVAIYVQSLPDKQGMIRMPSLDALLGRAQQQTVSQHRAALEVLSAQYGIPLRVRES